MSDLGEVLEKVKVIARSAGKILMDYFQSDRLHERTKSTIADIVTDADIASDDFIREQCKLVFPDYGVITEEGLNIEPRIKGQNERWICADPLDGTTNFSCNLPHFAVSICVVDSDFQSLVGVVYDPNRDEMFSGARGLGSYLESPKGKQKLQARLEQKPENCLFSTGFSCRHVIADDNNLKEMAEILPKVRCLRRLGSSALDVCYTAAARLDGYWELGPCLWDWGAARIIAEEAGCVITHYNGVPISRDTFGKPVGKSVIVGSPTTHKFLMECIRKARQEAGFPLEGSNSTN